jgi:hypothetical protein
MCCVLACCLAAVRPTISLLTWLLAIKLCRCSCKGHSALCLHANRTISDVPCAVRCAVLFWFVRMAAIRVRRHWPWHRTSARRARVCPKSIRPARRPSIRGRASAGRMVMGPVGRAGPSGITSTSRDSAPSLSYSRRSTRRRTASSQLPVNAAHRSAAQRNTPCARAHTYARPRER